MRSKWEDISSGSGVRRRIRFCEAENVIQTEITQPNMNMILDENQRWYNARSAKSVQLRPGESYTKVASIPFWLIEKWKLEEGLNFFDKNDRPKLMAKLNSSDYLKLRTAHGTLSTREETREF